MTMTRPNGTSYRDNHTYIVFLRLRVCRRQYRIGNTFVPSLELSPSFVLGEIPCLEQQLFLGVVVWRSE